MAYKEAPNTGLLNFKKWDTVGTVVEGRIAGFHHGMYKGKPTLDVTLKLADGSQATYKCVTSLQNQGIASLTTGTLIKMEYQAETKTKDGNPLKIVKLWVDDSAPVVQTDAADDEVPF